MEKNEKYIAQQAHSKPAGKLTNVLSSNMYLFKVSEVQEILLYFAILQQKLL